MHELLIGSKPTLRARFGVTRLALFGNCGHRSLQGDQEKPEMLAYYLHR